MWETKQILKLEICSWWNLAWNLCNILGTDGLGLTSWKNAKRNITMTKAKEEDEANLWDEIFIGKNSHYHNRHLSGPTHHEFRFIHKFNLLKKKFSQKNGKEIKKRPKITIKPIGRYFDYLRYRKKKSWKSCEEADSRTAEIEWMNTNLAHLTRSCVGFYSHPFELFKS